MPQYGMHPILRHLPDVFETERLIVRCPRPGDGVAVHAAVVETLAELRAWPASLPWAQGEPSVDVSEEFCRRACADYLLRRQLPMLVFLKSNGDLVGSSGLHDPDWSLPKFELGYWCARSYHGRGMMTEAVRGITEFGFATLGARRICIRTDAKNQPSRRLAERAGYTLEGILRNERAGPAGDLRDTCIYAITR